jgi:hypothetical protein
MALDKDATDAIAKLQTGLSRLEVGVCLAVNWSDYTVNVNVGGGVVDIPMAGTLPAVGDKVWVGFLGNLPVCLGPVPRPTTGVVNAAPSGGKVAVKGDDQVVYSVAYDVAYTPAVGHRVALDWSVPGGFLLGRLSSDAVLDPPPVVAPPAPSGPQYFDVTFNPTDSGTYGSRWQSTEVWASATTRGAWFYGAQMASTIPDNATIDAVNIYLSSFYQFGDSPVLSLHSQQSKGGAPDVIASHETFAGSGWAALPPSWGDALKTGGAFGIGTNHGGYHKYRPAGQGNSGALAIRWHV